VSPDSERSREAADVEKWIREALQGNREALGRLLDMCRHYLLLVANQELTPTLQVKVSPSDIVQETMMKAGRNFLRFQGHTHEELLAWLRCILRNNVTNARMHFETGKRQIDREIPLTEAPGEGFQQNLLDRGESPSGLASAREQNERLEQAMQQLPEHYRQVLRLHTTDGLTFEQTAEKLGSTAEAVRKLWRRAVEELAKRLEPPDEST
jgi:RNA polymerase sigma-70 factor (ECF subfamily)